MTDPRLLDVARENNRILEAMKTDVRTLREDNKYLKEMIREIKRSVTRKYDRKINETEEKVSDES